MIDTEELRRLADITQVLAYYGIYPNRAGNINCIAHADSHPSMKVYPRTNSVHCFACGADFDSIGVVMQIEDCDFKTACERLRAIFGLAADTKPQREIRRKMLALAAEKRREERQKAERLREFVSLTDLLHVLRKMYWERVPEVITDTFRENCDEALAIAREIMKIENELETMR